MNDLIKNIFGQVKVISIAGNHERRKKIEFFLHNYSFEFVIDLDFTTMFKEYEMVSDLPQSLFDKYDLDKEYCSRWSKGQMGCFATEKGILLKHASFGSVENLTIILDDAIFQKKWEENLIKAYSSLPANWDALILGTRLGKETNRIFRPLIKMKRRIFDNISSNTCAYNKYLDVPITPVNGVFGIIYSHRGISKMFNEPFRLRQEQDDVLLSRLIKSKYLNVYLSYPQTVCEGKYGESLTQKNKF